MSGNPDYIERMSEAEAKGLLAISEDAHSAVRTVCRRVTGVYGIAFVDDCVFVSLHVAREQGIADYIAYVESSR